MGADLMADINVKGLDSWSALHFAANENRLDVVKELLKHPDIQKETGSSIN
jgi:ankyrin repeat protein